jgi:hypothetical protein
MAINYQYSVEYQDGCSFHVIRTKVSILRPHIINAPLCNTSCYGINCGFFASGNPPTGASINWIKNGTSNYLYNGKSTEKYKRGTIYFAYMGNSTYYSQVVSVADTTELFNLTGNLDVVAAFGGGDLAIGMSDSNWKSQIFDKEQWSDFSTHWGPVQGFIEARRSGIGLKTENGERIAYLVVSKDSLGCTLYNLRHLIDALGCHSGLFLDGSASSQLQCKDNSGTLIQDKGYKPPNETNRTIWNMLHITNPI